MSTRLGAELAHNYRVAAPPKRPRAMLDFAAKPTERPDTIAEDDRAALKDAGFSAADIFDISEVAGFFNITNRVASGTEMRPNAEYDESAR